MRFAQLRAWAFMPLAAACSFHAPPPNNNGDGPPPEGMGSEMQNGTCFGSGPHLTICPPTLPGQELSITNATEIDTDAAAQCTFYRTGHAGVPDLCVRTATNIHITAHLQAVGDHPLVLLASGNITLDAGGTVDVSSHAGANPHGAGANDASLCGGAFASTAGTDSGGGAGGGGGGSFLTRGGTAGDGDGGTNQGGGPGNVAAAPDFLRGGCPGANGGAGGSGSGNDGDAGGGVYLVAGGAITIHGTVNASGEHGTGGPQSKGGGGGGGAGGMIVIFAGGSLDTAGATLVANGGGGGEGGTGGLDGGDGSDPDPADPLTAARGGSGAADGGNGGGGGVDTGTGGNGGNGSSNGANSGGGGGGGGGQGFIHVLSGQSAGGATMSPPPT